MRKSGSRLFACSFFSCLPCGKTFARILVLPVLWCYPKTVKGGTPVAKRYYTLKLTNNRIAMRNGMRDGIPIALGYFAVAFSLGIAARNAGLTAFQGFLTSVLCNASAGQYIGFTMIAASAGYLELALATLVTNARYLLMSCAMSQRMDPDMPFWHRFVLANYVTDEIFGTSIARPGYINPFYNYGVIVLASPGWAIGTALGIILGNLMPLRLVSAFSVALYGMFLAVFMPASRQDKVIAGLVAASFACSFAVGHIPGVRELSSGTRTMILTVALSALAAWKFPRHEEEEEADA